MHKLFIHNLGPVDDCELKCSQFMVFTGEQASGKSTIAKVLYYFRTVKDDMFDAVQENFHASLLPGLVKIKHEKRPLIKRLREFLRIKFFNTFGYSVQQLKQGMRIKYSYTSNYSITIRLIISRASDRKILHVDISKPLTDLINDYEERLISSIEENVAIKVPFAMIRSEINKIFNDDYETIIYLPSGRSMLSLLSDYINPYSVRNNDGEIMQDSVDYCTRKYIDMLFKLKAGFSGGVEGLIDYYSTGSNIPKVWEEAQVLTKKIIRGSYKIDSGEERITLDDGNYVRINFASSGQQDTLWITNLLFYYLVQKRPAMFIIEEPESHLFPSSQKYIMELISLVCNQGHSVIVTTHSPYVLGTLNNLLYASSFRKTSKQEEASKIIPSSLWLDYDKFQAWFVKGGQIEDCRDSEMKMIDNARIDEISGIINQEYDCLFELENNDASR